LSVAVVLALVAVAVPAAPAGAQEATVPQTGGGLADAERAAADLRQRVEQRRGAVVGGDPARVSPRGLERVAERVDLRTEHSRTFALSDGTFETELMGTPPHYDDGGPSPTTVPATSPVIPPASSCGTTPRTS
jgi:hypothetical protein